MRKALPFAGIILVAGGLFLLAWAGVEFLRPHPAPYHYVLVEEGDAGKFPGLGLTADGRPGLVIRKYEVRMEQVDEPLAMIHAAADADTGPVILDWQSNLAEPVINAASKLSDAVTLAEAVRKHAPEGSLVLAWWDTSRRLRLLGGSDVLFDRHLAEPVLIPDPWRRYADSIQANERKFWDASDAPIDEERFVQFADALLSDPAAGAAKLRKMAGNREAYLVLDIRDAYKLGVLRPERFGIGFKDFAKDVGHGTSLGVKNWLKGEGIESYTVHPLGETTVRAYFLTDKPSSQTLIAQALPFTGSQPMELKEINLVYQHADFWVYRIPPVAVAAGG